MSGSLITCIYTCILFEYSTTLFLLCRLQKSNTRVDKNMEEVYHGLFEHMSLYLHSGNDKNYNNSGLLSVEC
jgi:hypothetical protein